jgi:hypothetical protein
MKKSLLAIIGTIGLFMATADSAKADAWTCEMNGRVSGIKIGFIFGGQIISGNGLISCTGEDNSGNAFTPVKIPVKITILGGGVGFDFTIVRRLNVFSGAVGEVRNPRDLLGQFDVGASAGVTLIKRGYNVSSAISVKNEANGLGFELGMTGERAYGLGARLHGYVMNVEPLN